MICVARWLFLGARLFFSVSLYFQIIRFIFIVINANLDVCLLIEFISIIFGQHHNYVFNGFRKILTSDFVSLCLFILLFCLSYLRTLKIFAFSLFLSLFSFLFFITYCLREQFYELCLLWTLTKEFPSWNYLQKCVSNSSSSVRLFEMNHWV